MPPLRCGSHRAAIRPAGTRSSGPSATTGQACPAPGGQQVVAGWWPMGRRGSCGFQCGLKGSAAVFVLRQPDKLGLPDRTPPSALCRGFWGRKRASKAHCLRSAAGPIRPHCGPMEPAVPLRPISDHRAGLSGTRRAASGRQVVADGPERSRRVSSGHNAA